MTVPETASMLVLMRHGEAVSEVDDPTRPLSAAGRERVCRTAAWLAGAGLSLGEVRHSGKLRALQTAEILADRLGLAAVRVRAVPGLTPHDDVEAVAAELESAPARVALVGHLPHLARLASRVLAGDPVRLSLVFPDAAAAVMARGERGWHLLALVSPDLI